MSASTTDNVCECTHQNKLVILNVILENTSQATSQSILLQDMKRNCVCNHRRSWSLWLEFYQKMKNKEPWDYWINAQSYQTGDTLKKCSPLNDNIVVNNGEDYVIVMLLWQWRAIKYFGQLSVGKYVNKGNTSCYSLSHCSKEKFGQVNAQDVR